MRLIVDANVLVSALLGTSNRIHRFADQETDLMVVTAQMLEAALVLERFDYGQDAARDALEALCVDVSIIELEDVDTSEREARLRLGDRGQSDWPVLAAALELDAAIWSNDRDFFGVGVPVWSTRNLDLQFKGTGSTHA